VDSSVIHYEPGAFCLVGLATSDPAGAAAFYERVLGWQSEELPAGGSGSYTALRHRGKEVAILYRQTREARATGVTPHWTPYIAVDSADAGALRVRELGGTLLRGPHDVADAARVVAVRDPIGGIVSLWQARSRSGSELVDELGAFSWHELVTTDIERAKSFYGALLGWTYEPDASGFATITNARSALGTMREPGDGERVPISCWIPYFGVEHAHHAQRRAEQNGARTLGAPAHRPIGRTTVLADPQGAAFGLLERRAGLSGSASAD
jgi:predicted enzyme related to lactoylglutathione lyase